MTMDPTCHNSETQRTAANQANVKLFAQHCWGFPVLSAGELKGETWPKTHVLLELKHVEQTEVWVCPRIIGMPVCPFLSEKDVINIIAT